MNASSICGPDLRLWSNPKEGQQDNNPTYFINLWCVSYDESYYSMSALLTGSKWTE